VPSPVHARLYRTLEPAGAVARAELGDELYTVAVLAYQGEYGTAFRQEPAEALMRPSKGSLEDLFHETGLDYAFLDLSRADRLPRWLRGRLIARPIGYQEMRASWREVFDGILFLDRIERSDRAAAPRSATDERMLRLPDGLEMAYLDRGAGEPALVFVHCGNCRKEIWTETLDAFAPTHRVVAMDLPGHGRSGAGRDRFSIGGLGADVAALAEHLHLGKLVLIGNSLGGPVALEAARRLGRERVVGVVAVDTLNDVEQVWPEEVIRRRVEAYRRDFRGSCRELMLALLGKDAPATARARLESDTCANDPRAAVALMESIPAYDQAASLAGAGVPVRAINSTAFPTAVEVNRRHAVSFEVILMEGVGHYPQIERPAEFQRHLRQVVGELAARPASRGPG
jgi:pimeloyl-ACP methyl ester carboxylesterase